MFIFHLEQFYKYCPIDENDNCIKFKKSYNGNAKIVMDNHPLMIMAREEQKVKEIFFLLTANIFKNGPMPKPMKMLDMLTLLPSCKLG